jgi:hypothetical protein
VGEEKVNDVLNKVVRAEVGRLLRNEFPEKSVCLDCLTRMIHATSGPPYTKAQIRKVVVAVTETRGSLRYFPLFLCQIPSCGKVRACLVSTEGR